jgi:hypothetical protein
MTSGTRSNNEGKHIKTNTEIKTFKRKNKKKINISSLPKR